MNIFFYISLFVFGTLFGSFGSVVIHRLKSGEPGIINGDSHCSKCNKLLKWYHLVPIFSWLFSKGKCGKCGDKIGAIYPILEISTGLLFTLIGYLLIDSSLLFSGNLLEIAKLDLWLFIGFITILYVFYDILFLEIHEGIMLTGVIGSVLYIIAQSFGFAVIPSLTTSSLSLESITGIVMLILSLVILYGIMLKGWSEKLDILAILTIWLCIYIFSVFFGTDFPALQALIGALAIFSFFFLQIIVSGGAWMGGGDLRIAILIGMILGSSLWLPGLFATYFAGSIIGIILIIISKVKHGLKSKTVTQVPFGPFLAIGFFITVFYQSEIERLISIYF
ncbi:prepilin peptidase [Candidatus Gracilibacteria bacterium]|nr:prepilin peptidase [Candidatus Gracilibacteria bacterium]